MTAIEDNARSIFLAAVERAADQWPAFLDEACGGNAELRARVDQLLRTHQAMGSIHGGRIGAAAAVDAPLREVPGGVIGPYKLLEQIGEGGFGVVFMAEQTRPVRRMVALKVLKPGMDTRQVVARFEAERQALALMDHPNIARVFDGGETQAGRPYFVMELVRGIPITDFCDQNHLPVADRLGLFITVSQAVQHAHQKGVIHRDLKPTNVLVTMHDTAPVPKVIDFGIAKALGQRLTDKTLFTGFAQMVGTPLYMSPEQAQMSGLDVDTRTDVYALGVLLYELLTGTTPFDKDRLATAAYDEIRRIIREEDPPRPSTRLSTLGPAAAATVSADRKSDTRRLSQLFRGELDWVAMKALEKDRTRRYESAGALAADVERYLRDEAVQACPPTAGYKFRKFARRHKRALATAALTGLILLAALGVAAGSIGWAARDRAAREAGLEQEAGRALEEAEAWYRRDNLPEALSAVKRAEALLTGGAGRDGLRQRVRQWQADLKMVKRLEEIRLRQSEVKDHRLDHASADPAYAAAFREYGIDLASPDPVGAAERIHASGIREPLAAALDDWAWVKSNTDPDGRERLLAVARLADPDDWRNRFRDPGLRKNRQALEALADGPGVAAQPPTTVMLLGRALLAAGAGPKALAVISAAQQRRPDDFWLNAELGQVLLWAVSPARPQAAAGYCRAALALRPADPYALVNLGGALARAGEPAHLDEAVAALRRAIDLKPDYADAYNTLGWAYGMRKGDWAEAIRLYRQSLDLNPNAANVHYNLGVAYARTGQWPKAVGALEQAAGAWPKFAPAHDHLGLAYAQLGRWADAVAAYEAALPDGEYAPARNNLAWLLATCPDPARRDPRRAVELATQARDLSSQATHWNTLGVAHYRAGDWNAAVAALEKAGELRRGRDAFDGFFLAMAHWKLDHTEQARQLYDTAVRWAEKNRPVDEELGRFRAEAAQLLKIGTKQE
jgi:serine/threonine protein kinase/Flp pilus assembly protein TadD